jgi:hypothetical protein
MGELLAEQKAAGGLNPGTRPSKKDGGTMLEPPCMYLAGGHFYRENLGKTIS